MLVSGVCFGCISVCALLKFRLLRVNSVVFLFRLVVVFVNTED